MVAGREDEVLEPEVVWGKKKRLGLRGQRPKFNLGSIDYYFRSQPGTSKPFPLCKRWLISSHLSFREPQTLCGPLCHTQGTHKSRPGRPASVFSGSSDPLGFFLTPLLLLLTTPIPGVLASDTSLSMCCRPVCSSIIPSSPLAPDPCLKHFLFGHVAAPPPLFLIPGPCRICHQTGVGAEGRASS